MFPIVFLYSLQGTFFAFMIMIIFIFFLHYCKRTLELNRRQFLTSMIAPALITLAIDGALTGYMLFIWKIGAHPSSIIDILEFVSYDAFILLYSVKLLRTGHKNIIHLYGINSYQFSAKRLNEMKAEIKRKRALELEKR